MRIYTAEQRARIHEVTRIDPHIVDRVTDAYQCLINHDDVEGYRKHMLNAVAQLGFGMVIPPEERPTAVDKMKLLCVRSIAKQWNWPHTRVATWVEDATKP